jgi:hypothetical protein
LLGQYTATIKIGRDQDPRGRPTDQNLEGSKQLLARFLISQHRETYVSMEACAEQVQYQLPNQHSRVGFSLDATQNNDVGLQSAIASVRTDDNLLVKKHFKAAVPHLLPYHPVAKKRLKRTKREAGMIVSVMDIAEDGQRTHRRLS